MGNYISDEEQSNLIADMLAGVKTIKVGIPKEIYDNLGEERIREIIKKSLDNEYENMK